MEHIFPVNPSAEWANKEALEPYLWHIGNLTMLGARINASSDVANKGYAAKRKSYEKSSELEITNHIANTYQTWNEENIKLRAEYLCDKMIEVWNFDNPSRV